MFLEWTIVFLNTIPFIIALLIATREILVLLTINTHYSQFPTFSNCLYLQLWSISLSIHRWISNPFSFMKIEHHIAHLLKTQIAVNFATLTLSISVLVDSHKIFVRQNSDIQYPVKFTLFYPPHYDTEELYFSIFWCIFCWNGIFAFVGLIHLYTLYHDAKTNEAMEDETSLHFELDKKHQPKLYLEPKYVSFNNRRMAMNSMAMIVGIFIIGLSISSFLINRIHCADIPLFQLADSPFSLLYITILSTSANDQYNSWTKLYEAIIVSFALSTSIAYFVHEFQNADVYSGKREWLSPQMYASVFDTFSNKTTKITPTFLFSEFNGDPFTSDFKRVFYQCSLSGHVISMLTISNGCAYWILKWFQYFEASFEFWNRSCKCKKRYHDEESIYLV